MFIGLTYDLRQDYLARGYSEEETAEFDSLETIEALEYTIRDLGYDTERIGSIHNLTEKINSGQTWDMVFNICEGLYGFGREAQVPALLEAYQIPYVFSDPLVLSVSLHKGWSKMIARQQGIPTPDFTIIRNTDDLINIQLPFPLFAKPVAEGTGKGITGKSIIKNNDDLQTIVRNLLKKFSQPVLVETFLPGREFTVGIIGTGHNARAIGSMEIILKDDAEKQVYSYTNKEQCESLVTYTMQHDPEALQAAKVALQAWRALECRDGGRVDIRFDAYGTAQFIEVNPLAGLHPTHSDLPMIAEKSGLGYTEMLRQIIDSAKERYTL